eukprot:g8721.t1
MLLVFIPTRKSEKPNFFMWLDGVSWDHVGMPLIEGTRKLACFDTLSDNRPDVVWMLFPAIWKLRLGGSWLPEISKARLADPWYFHKRWKLKRASMMQHFVASYGGRVTHRPRLTMPIPYWDAYDDEHIPCRRLSI